MASHINTKRTLKNWQNFDQQLNILQDSGLIIENFERSIHYLSCIGYYRLSGYWYPFRKSISHKERDDLFIARTCFNNVLDIYQFDKKLRLICLDALERIEMAIRTEVSHPLGRSDPQAHLYKRFLDGDFTKYYKRFSKSKA
ncbi:Abi family protein [Psychrobacter sp. CAL346-MNA-CIBAN-0220]|uniref:Abi family protein n=1 Tax=Psychrobacter sp. CAL346-MNA-CIBAN-0220 TaxID=3140457 RepID=UPI003318DF31